MLLGAWVGWIGIAALAGPVWQALSGLAWHSPAAVLASLAASYMAIHLLMLALNFVSLFGSGDDATARSVANSVRVDMLRPSAGLGIGVAFWAALWLLARLDIAPEHFGALVLALALGLAGVIPSPPTRTPPWPEADAHPQPQGKPVKLGALANAIVIVLAFGGFAALMWAGQQRRAQEWMSLRDFTSDDLHMEVFIVVAAGIALVALILFASALFEGLSARKRQVPRGWVIAAALGLLVLVRVAMTPLSPFWRPHEHQGEGLLAARLPADAKLMVRYDTEGLHQMLHSRLSAQGIPFERVQRVGGEHFLVPAAQREATRRLIAEIERSGVPDYLRVRCLAQLASGAEYPVDRC
jgi:hypothetical protein